MCVRLCLVSLAACLCLLSLVSVPGFLPLSLSTSLSFCLCFRLRLWEIEPFSDEEGEAGDLEEEVADGQMDGQMQMGDMDDNQWEAIDAESDGECCYFRLYVHV